MVFRSMPKTTCKAVSGAMDLIVAKLFLSLSKSVGITVIEKFSLSKVALGYLSSAIPSEGKTLRPDGGALESEDVGPFSMKLQLFSHCWHFYMWSLRLCDYIQSIHICLVEINNQVCYSHGLDENSNGNGIEGLLILGTFLLESGLIDILYSSEPLNALLLIFCTQSRVQIGWIVFQKALRINCCVSLTIPYLSPLSNIAQDHER